MKLPPKGYVFDSLRYQSSNDSLNEKYKSDAAELKAVYPELESWPNWACCDAWMQYGEDTQYCGNAYSGEPRTEEFIAYLFIMQELADKDYFRREDGSTFTHFDVRDLDRIWTQHNADQK